MAKQVKLDATNCIWGIEASRILGVSKATFNNRRMKGIYNISCVRCPRGFRYALREVFKIAHPTVNNKQIEELILDYRLKKKVKKRTKTGVKQ